MAQPPALGAVPQAKAAANLAVANSPLPPVPTTLSEVSEKAFELLSELGSRDFSGNDKLMHYLQEHRDQAHLHRSSLPAFFVAWLFSEQNKNRIARTEQYVASHVAANEHTLAQFLNSPELTATITKIVEEKLTKAKDAAHVEPISNTESMPPDELLVLGLQNLTLKLDSLKDKAAQSACIQQDLPALEEIFRTLSPNQPNTATAMDRRDYMILTLLSILKSVTQKNI